MKTILYSILILLLCSGCCDKKQIKYHTESFCEGWSYALGDIQDAETQSFDDGGWSNVTLPHDFSISQGFGKDATTDRDGGYAYNGVAWYRKSFISQPDYDDNRVILHFDGVYRNSTIWVNGKKAGFNAYGYTPFEYDISTFLNAPGKMNVIAIRVDCSEQRASRWYTGGGIYRDVYLKVTDPVHIGSDGLYAKVEDVNEQKAMISLSVELSNDDNLQDQCFLKSYMKDSLGQEVFSYVEPVALYGFDTITIEQTIELENPRLWSPENPYLYKLGCQLYNSDSTIVYDNYECSYGVRRIRFDSEDGFFINGRHLKLKGCNNHHDGGPIGAACSRQTYLRQMQILKSMGCNALRISHNPPAQILLDVADSLGMLVIDELYDEWQIAKEPHGYTDYFDSCYAKDIRNWIRRDRNHPSVIAWSLGNEIAEQTTRDGCKILTELVTEARVYDKSRAFTAGCNNVPIGNQTGFNDLLDIVGYNYLENKYEADHQKYPQRVIFGSETFAYPVCEGPHHPYRSYKSWYEAQNSSYVMGEFIWTGFDYWGESGIGRSTNQEEYYNPQVWQTWPSWPCHGSDCGVVDNCGFPKPGYWFRKALWSDEPVVRLAVQSTISKKDALYAPAWGWPKVEEHWQAIAGCEALIVHCYTNCGSVELFVNGESQGKKYPDMNNFPFPFWVVPYQAGRIEAVALDLSGKEHRFAIDTAEEPASVELIAENLLKSDSPQDMAYVDIIIRDKNGIRVPFADNKITLEAHGECELAGIGNGNMDDVYNSFGNEVKAYRGRALAILKGTGRNGNGELSVQVQGIPKTAKLRIK